MSVLTSTMVTCSVRQFYNEHNASSLPLEARSQVTWPRLSDLMQKRGPRCWSAECDSSFLLGMPTHHQYSPAWGTILNPQLTQPASKRFPWRRPGLPISCIYHTLCLSLLVLMVSVLLVYTSPANGFSLGRNIQQSCKVFVKGPITGFVQYIWLNRNYLRYTQLATTILFPPFPKMCYDMKPRCLPKAQVLRKLVVGSWTLGEVIQSWEFPPTQDSGLRPW